MVVMTAPRLALSLRLCLGRQQMGMVQQPVSGRIKAPDAKLSQRQQDRTNPHRP
jgi:hypothetical protein